MQVTPYQQAIPEKLNLGDHFHAFALAVFYGRSDMNITLWKWNLNATFTQRLKYSFVHLMHQRHSIRQLTQVRVQREIE